MYALWKDKVCCCYRFTSVCVVERQGLLLLQVYKCMRRGKTRFSVVTGLQVYALWKDKFFYSGYIRSVTSDRQALVAFDDGNDLSVQFDWIIVCNLLPVGSSVLAPRSDEQSWSELATVVGHCDIGAEKGHIVKFVDDKFQCK